MSEVDILEDLVKKLSNLTVLEMSKLKTKLEDSWGVTATPVVSAVAAPVGAEEAKEEPTAFSVTLVGVDMSAKIAAIKAIRKVVPNVGLKEAKDLMEGVPSLLRDNVNKKELEEITKQMEAAGCKVEAKGV